MANQMDDLISAGLAKKDIVDELNDLLAKKDKLIIDLTERNNDLIKENIEAWGIVQDYRGDVWSGEHLSINKLNDEIENLKGKIEEIEQERDYFKGRAEDLKDML